MSWQCMNHYELQAMRKLLMLDVKEAVEHIGACSTRAWQNWEIGRNTVPADVDEEIYRLIGNRKLIIDNTISLENEIGALKFYKTLTSFISDYPKSEIISWRLHQSVTAYLFAEGGDVELSEECDLDKDTYIYQFFSKKRKAGKSIRTSI